MEKQTRTDAWGNILTGMGTKADKRVATQNMFTHVIPDRELESIYADDGLGARIVDLLPDDMTRQGWNYHFPWEKEGLEAVSNEYIAVMNKIEAVQNISKAMKWGRLYGGAILIIGALDGSSLEEPLNPSSIRSFDKFKVIPRPCIQYELMKFQMDPMKERYGEVELYPIQLRVGNNFITANVHYSRVIEFHGIEVPNTGLSLIPATYRYWGLPVLQRVKERLNDVGGAFGGISALLQELSIGKYRFKDLAEMLAQPDGATLVQNRIQAMDLMKSMFHSVLMDADDDFVRETVSFNGTSDILDRFFILISASTGYPITRLFGRSPSGLNATGEADTYNYYDMVRSEQELKLKPIVNRIVSIISEWKGLELPEIQFNPLEQMTEKEQAELDEKKANTNFRKAETYQKYMDMGVLEPEMIEVLEFGDTLKTIKDQMPSPLPDIEGEE